MIFNLNYFFEKYTSLSSRHLCFESDDFIQFNIDVFKDLEFNRMKISIFDIFGVDKVYPLKLYNMYNSNETILFEEKPTIFLENLKFDLLYKSGVNVIIKNCVVDNDVVLYSELVDD